MVDSQPGVIAQDCGELSEEISSCPIQVDANLTVFDVPYHPKHPRRLQNSIDLPQGIHVGEPTEIERAVKVHCFVTYQWKD